MAGPGTGDGEPSLAAPEAGAKLPKRLWLRKDGGDPETRRSRMNSKSSKCMKLWAEAGEPKLEASGTDVNAPMHGLTTNRPKPECMEDRRNSGDPS